MSISLDKSTRVTSPPCYLFVKTVLWEGIGFQCVTETFADSSGSMLAASRRVVNLGRYIGLLCLYVVRFYIINIYKLVRVSVLMLSV
jgi:hypothetical protein